MVHNKVSSRREIEVQHQLRRVGPPWEEIIHAVDFFSLCVLKPAILISFISREHTSSSSSCVIYLKQARRQQKIKHGKIMKMCSFLTDALMSFFFIIIGNLRGRKEEESS